MTRGKELFEANCATCHSYGNEVKASNPSAADLQGFGTEQWIRDFLREPGSPRFFGHTKLTRMANYVEQQVETAQQKNKSAELQRDWDAVAHWLGTHPERAPTGQDKGWAVFEAKCNRCHSFAGKSEGDSGKGPDFTGYGSAEWVRHMLMMPNHDSRYGVKNTMPAFRDLEGPGAAITKLELKDARDARLKDADAKDKAKIEQSSRVLHLSDVDRELIIRWLLNDRRLVFGGEPIVESAK
jgi:mono/diheme cytochrome c family protein